MATAGERWRKRQTRRLAREADRLEDAVKCFTRSVDRDKGPYADEARDVARIALDVARLASHVDGMQEVTDLMTEES